MSIQLSKGDIVLRPLEECDVDAVYEAITETLEDLIPWMNWAHSEYSRSEVATWIAANPRDWRDGTAYNFGITERGKVLGICGINQINSPNRFGNLGYWVRSSEKGRGIATIATRLLARWAIVKLDLIRIEIVADVRNKASCRVAEKSGAEFEGVLRDRLIGRDGPADAALYSLLPGDFKARDS